MKRIVTAILTLSLTLAIISPVKANTGFYTARATAYCLNGTTATGTQTTEGRTVASKREWFGATMYVWEDDGDGQIKPDNFVGVFTVEDTGGQAIQDGKVIDVFIPDYDEARRFGNKKIIFQIVEAEG